MLDIKHLNLHHRRRKSILSANAAVQWAAVLLHDSTLLQSIQFSSLANILKLCVCVRVRQEVEAVAGWAWSSDHQNDLMEQTELMMQN